MQDPLPLLIGGKGDRMLGLIARYADEWNMWSLPDDLAERSEVLARRCEAIGRDPAEIARSTQALVLLTDDAEAARRFVEAVGGRAAPSAGPADAARRGRGRVAPRSGVDEVIVPDFTLGHGAPGSRPSTLISEVAPSFR